MTQNQPETSNCFANIGFFEALEKFSDNPYPSPEKWDFLFWDCRCFWGVWKSYIINSGVNRAEEPQNETGDTQINKVSTDPFLQTVMMPNLEFTNAQIEKYAEVSTEDTTQKHSEIKAQERAFRAKLIQTEILEEPENSTDHDISEHPPLSGTDFFTPQVYEELVTKTRSHWVKII